MELPILITKFLEYLQYEKRFSIHTSTAYATDLAQFSSYIETTYSITKIEEINHTIVRSWVVSMLENNIGARTVNRKITTLKTFYKFLLRNQFVVENPMLKVLSPKAPKKLPVFVEKNKMDILLDDIAFGEDSEGIKSKLIIELFYATGMRLSELINLKKRDVDLYNCSLKVLGKRNKERIIPFAESLKQSIKKYLETSQEQESEYFFEMKSGKKLSESFVYKLVNTYLSQVTTIDKKSPHVLRHTFATHMLNNGADLNSIKDILGHANLSATQVYTHNTVEKLKNIHKQAHPKA
jgi:integrase/recombinase XerC